MGNTMRQTRSCAALVITLIACAPVCGCRHTSASGRRWGEDATVAPGWRRAGQAASDAFFDLRTLAPVAVAGAIAATGLDPELSDWAADETPVFGSNARARSYSDAVRDVLRAEALATAILAPSGELDRGGLVAKSKGMAVEFAAYGTSRGATDILKRSVRRQRPLEDDDELSFPSGHSSESFAGAALASRNVEAMDIARPLAATLGVVNTVAAASVAWARVEGKKHFPTDVLAGAALGNFFALFIHDAFLGADSESPWRIGTRAGTGLELERRF